MSAAVMLIGAVLCVFCGVMCLALAQAMMEAGGVPFGFPVLLFANVLACCAWLNRYFPLIGRNQE